LYLLLLCSRSRFAALTPGTDAKIVSPQLS
jgi:hypothetical protein